MKIKHNIKTIIINNINQSMSFIFSLIMNLTWTGINVYFEYMCVYENENVGEL